MGFLDSDFGHVLGDLANRICYMFGINIINGGFNKNGSMHSYDKDGKEITLGIPEIKFDYLSNEEQATRLYFKTDTKHDLVVMDYGFCVTAKNEDAKPLIMTNLDIKMHIPGNDGHETIVTLNHAMLNVRPQVALGSIKWKNYEEFFSLKDAILNDKVYLTWTGDVQWLDVDDDETKKLLEDTAHNPQPHVEHLSGTIPLVATPDKKMFDGVKNLLCWEYEILDERKVYFKDPLKDNMIYFLPQEYRIMALPSNAPDMSTEIKPDAENGFKALMRFRIAPYVHPNAKRDAYRIFLKKQTMSSVDEQTARPTFVLDTTAA